MSIKGGFIFEPNDFWGDLDVLAMTMEQVGIYVRLLSLQWGNGYIPEDVELIAVLASTGRCQVSNESLNDAFNGPLAKVFPVVEPGRRQNPRLAGERVEWKAKHGKQAEAGRKAGKASAAKRRETGRERPADTQRAVDAAPNESLKDPATGRCPSYPVPSNPILSDSSLPRTPPGGVARRSVDASIDCGAQRHAYGENSTASSTCANTPSGGSPCLFCNLWCLWADVLRQDADKKKARLALGVALKKASAAEILAGALRYAKARQGTPPDKVKHLFRWLQDERWTEKPVDTGRFR